MPSPTLRLVIDTNILIDLHRGGVLEDCFRLPFRFLAPDVIIAESHTPNAAALVASGWLEKVGFSGEEVEQVLDLVKRWRRVSTNDLFAFIAARREQAILLTGDKALRRLAEQHGVEVHGIFWLLEQMVVHKIIPPDRAAQALCRMRRQGRRLPERLYNQYLTRWKSP